MMQQVENKLEAKKASAYLSSNSLLYFKLDYLFFSSISIHE